MKSRIIAIGICLFVYVGTTNLFAQPDPQNETVIVVGSYDPTLATFRKHNTQPIVKDSTAKPGALTYNVFPQAFKTSFTPKPIKAAKMTGEPFSELYGNHIRLGFGTQVSPYGELWLNTKRSKDKTIGLHLRHFSSAGKVKNYAYPGLSENAAEFTFARYFRRLTMRTNVSFNRDVIHYYGFLPAEFLDTIEKDEIRQRYSLLNAGLSFQSNHPDSAHTNYFANIRYRWLTDADNNSEHELRFAGNINRKVKWLKFTKSQHIGLNLSALQQFDQLYNRNFSAGLVSLNPYISTKFDKIGLRLGMDMSMETDSTAKAWFFPQIEMNIDLLPGIITAFGGLDGKIERNGFLKLVETNPFVHQPYNIDYMLNNRILYGGVRGHITTAFAYSITAKAISSENYPLFVNDTSNTLGNWFNVVYDDLDWFRAEFNGNLTLKKKWDMGVSFAYNIYSTLNEVEAWHMPAFDGSLNIRYKLADKFIIQTKVFALGTRMAREYDNGVVTSLELKPILDVNLGVEYRYSKLLSAFMTFNNISASRYMRWNNYPSYSFNFLGGITYTF